MFKFFCVFFSSVVLFAQANQKIGLSPSQPDQILALSSEPDSLIGGFIHPLSGSLALRVIDLIAKGAQPIELTRTYIAPAIGLCDFFR